MLNLTNFHYREWVRATLHINHYYVVNVTHGEPKTKFIIMERTKTENLDICPLLSSPNQETALRIVRVSMTICFVEARKS